VGLAAAPATDAGGLAALHNAQFFTFPFENFDVLAGNGVNLDPDAVFDKLVRRRRGGYCCTSTSPKTHFTQLATVSLATPEGRISLRYCEFTEIDGSGERTRQIAPESYLEFIQSTFGIELQKLPRTIG